MATSRVPNRYVKRADLINLLASLFPGSSYQIEVGLGQLRRSSLIAALMTNRNTRMLGWSQTYLESLPTFVASDRASSGDLADRSQSEIESISKN